MNRFQWLATGALVSVLLLIFVGATVRVTGAGMGCPDWPLCWGRMIPPTSVEKVDFAALPIEKFRAKAERMGRDPQEITEATLRAEFNPRHVWTEFVNRLFSLPVGAFSLATLVAAIPWWRRQPRVFAAAFASLAVVLLNAWMGARVVYSGLQPGVLTAHLALAMGLLGLLAYCAWRGTERPWRVSLDGSPASRWVGPLVWGLLAVVVIEGVLGSQLREMTDEWAKFRADAPRETWIGELEKSGLYFAHRTLSWLVLLMAAAAWWLARRHAAGGAGKVGHVVFGLVLAQMVLGVVMSQVHIYSWVQVLHVGLAAVLLAFLWLWSFGLLRGPKKTQPDPALGTFGREA